MQRHSQDSNNSSQGSGSPVAKPTDSNIDLEKAPTPVPPTLGTGPSLDTFPDGGWEAWLMVVGGFCTVFSSFGWINCECGLATCISQVI
jgi:hypothetical protein